MPILDDCERSKDRGSGRLGRASESFASRRGRYICPHRRPEINVRNRDMISRGPESNASGEKDVAATASARQQAISKNFSTYAESQPGLAILVKFTVAPDRLCPRGWMGQCVSKYKFFELSWSADVLRAPPLLNSIDDRCSTWTSET
jgi:hypothetical protein